jgi:hypothetical protein
MYKLNIKVENIEKSGQSLDGDYDEYDTGVLQLSIGNQLQILNDAKKEVIFEGGLKDIDIDNGSDIGEFIISNNDYQVIFECENEDGERLIREKKDYTTQLEHSRAVLRDRVDLRRRMWRPRSPTAFPNLHRPAPACPPPAATRASLVMRKSKKRKSIKKKKSRKRKSRKRKTRKRKKNKTY